MSPNPDAFPLRQTLDLALGIDPLDALLAARPPHPLRIDVETDASWTPRRREDPYFRIVLQSHKRPAASRHNTGRQVIVAHPALGESLTIRIYDHDRRYVPRRLRIPLVPPGDYEDRELFVRRARRPHLYPGAAYDVGANATGLRGHEEGQAALRAVSPGAPEHWLRR